MGRYWVHSAPQDDLDDQGRECARGPRCADARIHTVDGHTIRTGAPTPRGLCDSCAALVQRALTELPGLWARVHAELGTRTQPRGPRVATSKSAPLPINLAADELLRDIVYVLTSWHERVAAVARLAGEVGRRVDHATVQAACRVLAAHVGPLLALPPEPMLRAMPIPDAAEHAAHGALGLVHIGAGYADVIRPLSGVEAGLEVLQLHYRCRRLLGETRPPARHLPAPCRCGYKQLFEVLDGDGQWDGAFCRNCRAEYTMDDYWGLVREVGEMVAKAGVRRRRLVRSVGDDTGSRRGTGHEPYDPDSPEIGTPYHAIIV